MRKLYNSRRVQQYLNSLTLVVHVTEKASAQSWKKDRFCFSLCFCWLKISNHKDIENNAAKWSMMTIAVRKGLSHTKAEVKNQWEDILVQTYSVLCYLSCSPSYRGQYQEICKHLCCFRSFQKSVTGHGYNKQQRYLFFFLWRRPKGRHNKVRRSFILARHWVKRTRPTRTVYFHYQHCIAKLNLLIQLGPPLRLLYVHTPCRTV